MLWLFISFQLFIMPLPTPENPRIPDSSFERTVVHVLMRHYRVQGYSASRIVSILRQTEGWIVQERNVRHNWNKELEEIRDHQDKLFCGTVKTIRLAYQRFVTPSLKNETNQLQGQPLVEFSREEAFLL